MSEKYDTTGNLEAQFEPVSENRVLVNKLGISKAEEMDDVELILLNQLRKKVFSSIVADQRIAVADVCNWHQSWLGNVYAWAGQYRTLNMAKGSFHFAACSQIPKLMNDLDKNVLSIYTPCAGMPETRLIEAIAVIHVELILIHPFREGNGRLSRLLASVMALQAGWPQLDFRCWDKRKTDYFAAIQTGMVNYEPMKGLVRQVLREAYGN